MDKNSRIVDRAYGIMRITPNRQSAQKHYDRVKGYLPSTGTVMAIRLTEKQYANITYLVGEPDLQEKNVGKNCHIML